MWYKVLHSAYNLTLALNFRYIMGRGRDPYVGLARKRPKTKWRLQLAEDE